MQRNCYHHDGHVEVMDGFAECRGAGWGGGLKDGRIAIDEYGSCDGSFLI